MTGAEQAEVNRLIAIAKEEMGPAGRVQREVWSATHISKMRAAGVSEEQIDRTINAWLTSTLLPDAILEFVKPELSFATVRQILEDPAKYDGELCYHPIDGRDYNATGKFFAKSRQIYSFGHGGCTFRLHDAEMWAEDAGWDGIDDVTPYGAPGAGPGADEPKTEAPGTESPQPEAPQPGVTPEDIYAAFMDELATIPKVQIPEWLIPKIMACTVLSPALEDEILGQAGKKFGGKRQLIKMLKEARAKVKKTGKGRQPGDITAEDFFAYMPMHQYIYIPTRELWPTSSVNGRLGEDMNMWIDENRHVEQMTWAPGKPMLIENTVVQDAGFITKVGVSCFNLYQPPVILPGDATKAGMWLDHLHFIYPDNADHIINWFAQRIQHPDVKINHALLLGGIPGIGKDMMLEPVKRAVGHWNFAEVDANQVMGRFNGFLKSTVMRISEVKDLGDVTRYEFYNHMKGITAAPPDALRVDEKNLREHYIMNVTGIIYTTNHRTDSLYLPANDRRHYCTWSDAALEDFASDYFVKMYEWYEAEGYGHVAACLRELDISRFNPKAPPLKTPAFWALVDAGKSPENAELADIIDILGNPEALTIEDLVNKAQGPIFSWLTDRKNRRQIPHRLEGCEYTEVRNDCAKDGLWKINGARQMIYAQKGLSRHQRFAAASERSQSKAKAFDSANDWGKGFKQYQEAC